MFSYNLILKLFSKVQIYLIPLFILRVELYLIFAGDKETNLPYNSFGSLMKFFSSRRGLSSSRRELLSSHRGLLSSRRELKNCSFE